ncbi:unnamed protein product [Paramecium octaurelia]|uniref:Uncharacterized protein n=1 Tax=Paramecium octaurelia TaxID=43137 RepID=A0A8S1XHK1_PAROT|nr:unnamed protein product [Paramecium octaurelia]
MELKHFSRRVSSQMQQGKMKEFWFFNEIFSGRNQTKFLFYFIFGGFYCSQNIHIGATFFGPQHLL